MLSLVTQKMGCAPMCVFKVAYVFRSFLGVRSTDLRGKLGGYSGRPLLQGGRTGSALLMSVPLMLRFDMQCMILSGKNFLVKKKELEN